MSSLLVFMCVLPVLKISLFYATATSAIYTLSLHDALPISFAVNDPGGTVQSFHIHLLQRGGDLFDAEGTPTLKTPEAEETLAFLVDGVQSGFIATVADMYGPSVQSGLKSGHIIAVNMPSWYSSYGIQDRK